MSRVQPEPTGISLIPDAALVDQESLQASQHRQYVTFVQLGSIPIRKVPQTVRFVSWGITPMPREAPLVYRVRGVNMWIVLDPRIVLHVELEDSIVWKVKHHLQAV